MDILKPKVLDTFTYNFFFWYVTWYATYFISELRKKYVRNLRNSGIKLRATQKLVDFNFLSFLK
jgi:hypothetical protein